MKYLHINAPKIITIQPELKNQQRRNTMIPTEHYQDLRWTHAKHFFSSSFSEGLLSWLGSRDLLETLAFPETLNWSQKGVCCLQTSSHLLKLCRKPIGHSRAQTVASFVAYGSFQCHLTDRGKNFKFKPKSEWVWCGSWEIIQCLSAEI